MTQEIINRILTPITGRICKSCNFRNMTE